MRNLVALTIVLASAACVSEQGDPRDEDVIVGGKSDSFDISEGSPDALRVLELVNTADEDTLKVKVGLASSAYTRILSHRAGADGVDGTADDDHFDTLLELDQVPYVGLQTFEKLLTYARANDCSGTSHPTSSDPFDPASCTGTPMTLAEFDAHKGDVALYQFKMRERQCPKVNGVDTCGDWGEKPVSSLAWATSASGLVRLGLDNYNNPKLWLFQNTYCGPYASVSFGGSECSGVGGVLQCSIYRSCSDQPFLVYGGSVTPVDQPNIQLSGDLTSGCLRLTSTVTNYPLNTDGHRETEVAVLATF